MNWFVALLLLPALVLVRLLGLLTAQFIVIRGWQQVLVSFVVYGAIVASVLLR